MKLASGLFVLLVLSACSMPQTQPQSTEQVQPTIAETHFVMEDGYTLPFALYGDLDQSQALVVALHGFNDYRKAFEGFCSYLAKLQVSCIAYDQRGFGQTDFAGLWPAPDRLEQDLTRIVSLIEQRYPNLDIYLAGESMGGAVILSNSAKDRAFDSVNVRGEILFAPAVWARTTQPWYQRWALWLAVHTFPDWKPTGESLEIIATDNIEALRAMSRDPYVIKETRIDTVFGLTNLMDRALAVSDQRPFNVLVMYGEKDEVIPKYPTCQMLNMLGAAGRPYTLKLYTDGYHMLTRDRQAERVFRDVYEWIVSPASLESDNEKLDDFCAS